VSIRSATTAEEEEAFMKTVLLETPIPAPVEVLWEALTDLPRYREWNPFITAIEGDLHPGAELRATFALPGRKPRTFTPTVTAVEPEQRISWLGRLWLPGLVDAAHSLEITIGASGPVFVHREDFRGLLVPALGGLVRDTHAAFAAMNAALVQRVAELGNRPVDHQLRQWG
jgi:hypothetical protein